MTDSENIDLIQGRIKRIQKSQNVQTVFLVLSIFGIVSIATLVFKAKKLTNFIK